MQLAHAGELRDRFDVDVVERVTGVEPHAPRTDGFARSGEAAEFGDHCRTLGVAPARVERVGVRPGMHLADRGADPVRGINLPLVGVDEHADDDPRLAETRDGVLQRRLAGDDVEAALGRHLLPALGDEHRHLRPGASGDRDHLVGRRHLEVELDVGQLAQPAHVLVLDVPTVLAQVDGDAVGAAEVRLDRRPHRIRFVGPPRLPDGGHVVDVDAELDHRLASSRKIVRLCSGCRSSRRVMANRISCFAACAVAGAE
jgi:hypothetical protein